MKAMALAVAWIVLEDKTEHVEFERLVGKVHEPIFGCAPMSRRDGNLCS